MLREFETSIKFCITEIGKKYEKLSNKFHDVFEDLRESRIINVEYDSDNEGEIEVKIKPKPRITVSRLQLFSKKTPKELGKGAIIFKENT